MAKGKGTSAMSPDNALELEDIQVRATSVVLSVRLDPETAKRLHRITREQGRRMSDVLRDAAVALAKSEGSADRPVSEVSGADLIWKYGQWPAASIEGGRAPKPLYRWGGAPEVVTR